MMTIDESANGDRAGVLVLNAALLAAWNAHDADAFVEPWNDDADHINILGDLVVGKPAVLAATQHIFGSLMARMTSEATVRDVRFPGPDVAILDVDQVMRGVGETPAGPLPWVADGALRTRIKIVATKCDGRWTVASFQNTAVLPRRGPR
jgi:uncharacterized protein (TIGR02246 family)